MSSKKNYLKKFESKIEETESLYDDEIKEAKDIMYNNVIDLIADSLGFEIDKTEYPLHTVAKTLYKFFVLEYNTNLTYFLEMYIIENKKDIAKSLEDSIMNPKRIEGLDSKTAIILNNIADTIDIIAGADISFDEYVRYITMHPEVSASASAMLEYDNEILSNTDEFVDSVLQDLKNEEEGFGKIYTDLQLNIFDRYKTSDF